MRLTSPLIALAAFATSAEAAPYRPIQLHMANFRFAPASFVLDRGQNYTLTLISDGGDHSFFAPAFFAASGIPAAERVRLESGREVEVASRTSVTIHLTAPAAPGRYKFKCTHAMHNLFGMNGQIIVR